MAIMTFLFTTQYDGNKGQFTKTKNIMLCMKIYYKYSKGCDM